VEDSLGNILSGGIDLHTHSSPGAFARSVDDFELAEQARDAGMRGVVIKAHEVDTSYRALLVAKKVTGVQVFGGLVLNQFVGGLNPEAVDLALKVGARMIWMPTISSRHHLEYTQRHCFSIPVSGQLPLPARKPISILDKHGRVLSEVHEIIRMIAEADACLSTGHLSPREIELLTDACMEAHLARLLITHADLALIALPIAQQVELARKGAFMEKCAITMLPQWGGVSAPRLMAGIRQIGIDRCVLASDYGQAHMPPPVQGLELLVEQLIDAGARGAEVRQMLVDNPAYLLGLPF
jgi:hypothetical protein